MKICLINFNCYCLFNPASAAPMGGAELEMYTLARCFARKNHHVSVVVADWGQSAVEEYEGVAVHKSIQLGATNYLQQLIIFWKILARINADVYISTGAGMEVGAIAAFCRFNHKKYLYRTAHDMDCDESFIHSTGLAGRAYAYGLHHAYRIVTSVQAHTNLLSQHHPSLVSKVAGINLALELPEKGGDVQKNTLLWVSRCETWKQPELFLDLAKALPEQKCVMIAPAQKHRPELFLKIKKEAQAIANLEFIDFVPFKNIQPYFEQAKVFVNTSQAEGFTYTLIQCGAAKTPVVYLSVNPNEVITKNSCGFWANGDTAVLQEQVKTLLQDKKVWKQKSEGIHAYVTMNHAVEVVGKQWENLFAKIGASS